MTRTVTSGAGKKIEVLTDEEWCQLTEQPLHSLMWTQARAAVLGTLWHEGSFTDPQSGRATGKLLEVAQAKYGYSAQSLTGLIAQMVNPNMQVAIKRELKGKRTFRIELVALPESWLDRLLTDPELVVKETPPLMQEAIASVALDGETQSYGDTDSHLSDEPLYVHVETPIEVPIELQVTEAVAASLLTQVIDLIKAGPKVIENTQHIVELESDLRVSQMRLSQRLEENDKLRRLLRETQDELGAVKVEANGLRQRLKVTEYNLEKAMNGDAQRIIQGEVFKELEKVMRAKPASSKGPDAA